MQKFNIPARDLPVLRLSFHGSPAGHIEPEDLWIVGTNGRLVLVNRGEHYIIIDTTLRLWLIAAKGRSLVLTH